MGCCDKVSVVDVGSPDHTAFAAWVKASLSQAFDMPLHEPLPEALLAILDAGMESKTVPRLV